MVVVFCILCNVLYVYEIGTVFVNDFFYMMYLILQNILFVILLIALQDDLRIHKKRNVFYPSTLFSTICSIIGFLILQIKAYEINNAVCFIDDFFTLCIFVILIAINVMVNNKVIEKYN